MSYENNKQQKFDRVKQTLDNGLEKPVSQFVHIEAYQYDTRRNLVWVEVKFEKNSRLYNKIVQDNDLYVADEKGKTKNTIRLYFEQQYDVLGEDQNIVRV